MQENAAFWEIFGSYLEPVRRAVYDLINKNEELRKISHRSLSYWSLVEDIAKEAVGQYMGSWAPPWRADCLNSMICIDEAREFIRYEPDCRIDTLSHMNRAARLLPRGSIFTFMDTLGDINILDPGYVFPSARARTEGTLQATFTDLVYWDLIATTEGVEDIKTVFDTTTENSMIRFGRPLWGAASRAGYQDVLGLARLKLALVKHVIRDGLHRLAQLAILASRIDIQVNPFHQETRELTGSYMAYVRSFDSASRALVVSYPSDPLLSAAARSILMDNPKDNLWGVCIWQLSQSLNNRLTLPGDRGELAGQILCCYAADIAMGKEARSDGSLSVESFLETMIGRDALEAACCKETLHPQAAQRLLAGRINFNHFIRVEGYTPNRQDLIKFLQRRAAVICKKGQWGADLIIPIVLERPLRETSTAHPKPKRVPLPKTFVPFQKHKLELCGEPTSLMTHYAKEVRAALKDIWGVEDKGAYMKLDVSEVKGESQEAPPRSVVSTPERIAPDTYLLNAQHISYIIVNCKNYQGGGSRLPKKIKHLNPFSCGIEKSVKEPPPPYFALGLFFNSKAKAKRVHSDLVTYEASSMPKSKNWVDQYGLTRAVTNVHVRHENIEMELATLLKEIPQIGGDELERAQALLRLVTQSPLIYGTVFDYKAKPW